MKKEKIILPKISWNWYNEIENRFNEYCEYVPITRRHFKVWSLKLASLTIETCSILDSFFKSGISHLIRQNPVFQSTEYQEERKSVSQDKPNIWVWKRFYNTYYELSKKGIQVIPLRKTIYPFKEWEITRNPSWWETYNDIKHDRFKNLEKATLKSTLCALGGLFIALIIHIPNKIFLYENDIIKLTGLHTQHNYRCADMLLRKEPILLYDRDHVIASTSLFAYKYQKTRFSQYIPSGGWPSDKLYPECKDECTYTECYRSYFGKE